MKYLLLTLALIAACADDPPQMRVLEGAELELKRAEAHTRLAARLAHEAEYGKPQPKPRVNEAPGDWFCPIFLPWLAAGGGCPSPTNPEYHPGYDAFSFQCTTQNDLNQQGLHVMTGPDGNGWCLRFVHHNWTWFGEHWYSNPHLGNGMNWNDKIRSWQANDVLEVYFWEHINYGGNAFVWTFGDNEYYHRWFNMPADRSSIDILMGF